jgi:hypothetical protein
MQFKEIPRKVIVAKRLSQCLNPALPTGVHQRALDVYAHILGVIGVRLSFIPKGESNSIAFSWMACVETCSCGRRVCSRSSNIQQHP